MGKEFDFASLVSEVAAKFGKSNLVEKPYAPIAIKLPALILRVLFQNEGLILGKIVHIVGKEATFKSTLALEITRWHLEYNGYGITLHTESRLNDTVIDGVLGTYKDRHTAIICDTLEEWQAILMDASKKLGESQQLACFTVDSVMGVSSEKTISEVTKEGFASAKFAHEANLIASYLRVFNAKLYDRPHTVCIINHRKFRPNMNSYGPPEKASLGGNEIKFCASYEIETTASESAKQVLGPVTVYDMGLKLDKNTFGQEGVQIRVPVRFINASDGTQVIFDWHAATTYMLSKANVVRPAPSSTILKRLGEIITVSVRRGGPKGDLFYSEQLGIQPINAVSATEFGMALEERSDILQAIYELFGIFRRYIYNPELSYSENVDKAVEFYKTVKQPEQNVNKLTEDEETN